MIIVQFDVNGYPRRKEELEAKSKLLKLDLLPRVIPKEKVWTMRKLLVLLPCSNPSEFFSP